MEQQGQHTRLYIRGLLSNMYVRIWPSLQILPTLDVAQVDLLNSITWDSNELNSNFRILGMVWIKLLRRRNVVYKYNNLGSTPTGFSTSFFHATRDYAEKLVEAQNCQRRLLEGSLKCCPAACTIACKPDPIAKARLFHKKLRWKVCLSRDDDT